MTTEINIRTIEEPDDLDHTTLHDLIYLTNHLPESSEMHGASHTAIQASLEQFVNDPSSSTALMIAEQEPLGRAVGYVAAQIDPETHELAEIMQIAVVPHARSAREIGNLLIKEVESWSEQHEARVVLSDYIEFTGRVIANQVVEIVPSRDTMSAHPANFLG